MSTHRAHPLVAADKFILATRDTGYRTTASAIAELVDNSVQAGAKRVRIWVLDGAAVDGGLTVTVLDDGRGMDEEALRRALQFGGSERFNDRSGSGRFGMGLPNSSVSQARRVDVYSWRPSSRVSWSFIDVDEIATGRMQRVPRPRRGRLPEHLAVQAGRSGTAVVWTRCDRLDNKRASTITRKLAAALGRGFRYFLWAGGTIEVNGDRVVAVDPLYCSPDAVLGGAAFHLQPLLYDVRVPDGSGRTSRVEVRFSRMPIADWRDWPLAQKRRFGIVGGAGMSVVRSGREIDHGWYFFGTKRKQNYDDWWRCELRFEPALDELFGVTHSKQGVTPTPELLEIITPDVEAVARSLSAAVRVEFAKLGDGATRAAERAEEREWRLPPAPRAKGGGAHAKKSPVGTLVHAGRLEYDFLVKPTGAREFFSWQLLSGRLVVALNSDHPFYERIYAPIADGRAVREDDLRLLLLAAARVELQRAGALDVLQAFRAEWSDVIAAFLGG